MHEPRQIPDGLGDDATKTYRALFREHSILQNGNVCFADLVLLEVAARAIHNHNLHRTKQALEMEREDGNYRLGIAAGAASQAEARAARAALSSLGLIGAIRSEKSRLKTQRAAEHADQNVTDWDNLLPGAVTRQ